MPQINWEKTHWSTALIVSVILMALVNIYLAVVFAVVAVIAIIVVKVKAGKNKNKSLNK